MKRKVYIVSSVSALLLAASTVPAAATLIFATGNNPQSGDENILLNSGLSRATISGSGNQSGFQVDFSSTQETLRAPANGQARVEASSGSLNEVSIVVPGGSFETLIFNAFTGSGTLNILAVANEPGGGTQNFNFSYVLGNGQNFSTLTSSDGTIASVTLTSVGGFTDLRQVRLGGIDVPSSVPDGGTTAALLGLGIAGLALFRRKQS